MVESKRIKNFRLSIAKEIPKFPNDKATLQALEAKSLASLLIDYANWASRLVAPRQRKVSIEPTATNDPRWKIFSAEITAFLDKVRKGENLTPHLSLDAHTRGFTPASSEKGSDVNRWADKDFLLNVMGYHHFHLGLTLETAGHAARTNDVLFAAVNREHFDIVALFDHRVFDMDRSPTAAMNAERQRLWKIFDQRTMRGRPPGSVVIPAMITTSGHALHFVTMADYYADIVREIDPKLDDQDYVKGFYHESGRSVPAIPKLCWHLHYLDIGLLDEEAGVLFVLKYGPN